jgi:hypothetical protein
VVDVVGIGPLRAERQLRGSCASRLARISGCRLRKELKGRLRPCRGFDDVAAGLRAGRSQNFGVRDVKNWGQRRNNSSPRHGAGTTIYYVSDPNFSDPGFT